MRKIIKVLSFFVLYVGTTGMAAAQVVGDYRTVAPGKWDSASTWQLYDGTAWVAATSTPSASNSVFIEGGHTVTLTQNESCNDVNLNNGSGDKIVTNSFTLNMNGKFRAYTGTAPGSNSAVMPNSGWLNTSGGGKISVVGGSRNLVNTGEWSANPPGWTLEFALNPGEMVTCFTNMKAGNITIASGTVAMSGSTTLRADSGSAGTGNITINSDATLRVRFAAIQ